MAELKAKIDDPVSRKAPVQNPVGNHLRFLLFKIPSALFPPLRTLRPSVQFSLCYLPFKTRLEITLVNFVAFCSKSDPLCVAIHGRPWPENPILAAKHAWNEIKQKCHVGFRLRPQQVVGG